MLVYASLILLLSLGVFQLTVFDFQVTILLQALHLLLMLLLHRRQLLTLLFHLRHQLLLLLL